LLGHRRKLLAAIAELSGAAPVMPQPASPREDFPYWGAVALEFRARSTSALGRVEEALPLFDEALATYRRVGTDLDLPSLLLGLANAHGKADRPIVGLKHLDEAAHRVEETEHRLIETDMHRIRGELLLAINDGIAAEASFRQAVNVAGRQNGS
jgi:hypothetical protein